MLKLVACTRPLDSASLSRSADSDDAMDLDSKPAQGVHMHGADETRADHGGANLAQGGFSHDPRESTVVAGGADVKRGQQHDYCAIQDLLEGVRRVEQREKAAE